MTMPDSPYHVGNTTCPECGRTWTGEFKGSVPDVAICRDCLPKTNFPVDKHQDIHLNPKAR